MMDAASCMERPPDKTKPAQNGGEPVRPALEIECESNPNVVAVRAQPVARGSVTNEETLARTKALLVGAYGLHALTCAQAEQIASRLRLRYAESWRAA